VAVRANRLSVSALAARDSANNSVDKHAFNETNQLVMHLMDERVGAPGGVATVSKRWGYCVRTDNLLVWFGRMQSAVTGSRSRGSSLRV
jgi:hypothetical protein